MYTKDFFISYTRSDLEWAKWIAWELREANYTYVLQHEHFAPGQDFIHRMRTALKECRHVIAVLSADYLRSEFAAAEMNAALSADPLGVRARLIPIRVRECTLDEMLKSRIYINLVGKTDLGELRHDLLTGVSAAKSTVVPEPDDIFEEPPKPPIELTATRPQSVKMERVSRQVVDSPRYSTVLFLGLDIGRGLGLRRQFRGIREILSEAVRTGPFRVKGRFDVTAETLPDVLASEAPRIVHFSGNQNGGRILIRSQAGGVTTIPAGAVRGMMQTLEGAVRLAIIDTCDSLPCAREVATAVEATLGVSGKPYDEDAILFYETFYRALSRGGSVGAAHKQAVAAHRLRGVPATQTPHLCARKSVNLDALHFRKASTVRRGNH